MAVVLPAICVHRFDQEDFRLRYFAGEVGWCLICRLEFGALPREWIDLSQAPGGMLVWCSNSWVA